MTAFSAIRYTGDLRGKKKEIKLSQRKIKKIVFLAHASLCSVKIISTVGVWAQGGNWESLLSFKHGGDTVRFVFSSKAFLLRAAVTTWRSRLLSSPRGGPRPSYICHYVFAESDGLS